jgi:hypothetical protein
MKEGKDGEDNPKENTNKTIKEFPSANFEAQDDEGKDLIE